VERAQAGRRRRLTDQGRRRQAQDALGRPIHRLEGTTPIEDEDTGRGRVQDHGEARLSLPRHVRRPTAFGDVTSIEHDPRHTRGVEMVGDGDLHPPPASGRVRHPQLDRIVAVVLVRHEQNGQAALDQRHILGMDVRHQRRSDDLGR
jgi:hypothetical protein